MGLDMYLQGKDFIPTHGKAKREIREGFPIESYNISLAQWRKHAPLHCYIVKRYSEEGKDDCEPITLSSEDLRTIADVIRHGDLPPDDECQGFFFGTPEMWAGYRERAEEDAELFDKAADWLDRDSTDESWRTVIYRASW
jgi:hypothetical protein